MPSLMDVYFVKKRCATNRDVMSRTSNKATKAIQKLGLSYDSTHVCYKGCVLFGGKMQIVVQNARIVVGWKHLPLFREKYLRHFRMSQHQMRLGHSNFMQFFGWLCSKRTPAMFSLWASSGFKIFQEIVKKCFLGA